MPALEQNLNEWPVVQQEERQTLNLEASGPNPLGPEHGGIGVEVARRSVEPEGSARSRDATHLY